MSNMDQFNGLTNREREVAKLVLEGKSNKQIALALQITDNTVEFHLKNIYSKVEVSSRTELILKLRSSVVADGADIVENGARPKFENWVTALRKAASRVGKEFKLENLSDSTARGGKNSMTFFESIVVCFKKYAEFNGRASRSEFWWFMLFVLLTATALTYISETLGSVFLIAVLLPLLAVGTRRLRDCGQSPWWQLFLLVPAAGVFVTGYLWTLPPVDTQPDEAV